MKHRITINWTTQNATLSCLIMILLATLHQLQQEHVNIVYQFPTWDRPIYLLERDNLRLNGTQTFKLKRAHLISFPVQNEDLKRNNSVFWVKSLKPVFLSASKVVGALSDQNLDLNQQEEATDDFTKSPLPSPCNRQSGRTHHSPTHIEQVEIAESESSDSERITPSNIQDMFPNVDGNGRPCARYLVADHAGSGFGHRLATVVFAASLADEFGFRVALSDRLWSTHAHNHGNYSALWARLGRGRGLPSESELALPAGAEVWRHSVSSREDFLHGYAHQYRHQCHVVVTAALGGPKACRRGGAGGPAASCFTLWPGAFRRARRVMQRVAAAAAATAGAEAVGKLQALDRFWAARARGELAMAWHLRCGDVVLWRPLAFFVRVRGAIAAAGVPVRHYLVRSNCSAFDYLYSEQRRASFLRL